MPRPIDFSLTQVIFSDLTNNLGMHPVTGNITRLINRDAVKQSVRNIVLTNRGERLYKPNLGADIRKLLFENIVTDSDIFLIKDKIKSSIETYEPRVEIVSIELLTSENIYTAQNTLSDLYIEPSSLGNEADNSIAINIVFNIINTDEQADVNIIIERNR
jgi:phage baseplate assembly protein W